jgi:hypothetical protein
MMAKNTASAACSARPVLGPWTDNHHPDESQMDALEADIVRLQRRLRRLGRELDALAELFEYFRPLFAVQIKDPKTSPWNPLRWYEL